MEANIILSLIIIGLNIVLYRNMKLISLPKFIKTLLIIPPFSIIGFIIMIITLIIFGVLEGVKSVK